jgi:hypothetical protein
MLWSILGLIGGSTFIVNGVSVLFDSKCHTVGFGGGRVIQATCYPENSILQGEFPGPVAGLGMLAFGFLILYFSWRNLRRR